MRAKRVRAKALPPARYAYCRRIDLGSAEWVNNQRCDVILNGCIKPARAADALKQSEHSRPDRTGPACPNSSSGAGEAMEK